MVNQYDKIADDLFVEKESAPLPASGNQYESIAKETFDSNPNKFKQSQFVAKSKNTDRVTEASKIARKRNLPVSFVERNLESFKEKSSGTDMSYEAIVEQSPRLAKWLEDPYKASVSNDDLETLSKVERNTGRIKPYIDQPSYGSDIGDAIGTGWNNLENSGMLLAAAYGVTDIDTVAQSIADRNKKIRERQQSLPIYAKKFQETMDEEGGDVDKAFKRFKGSFKKIKEQNIIDGLIDFGAGGGVTVAEALDQFYEAAKQPKGFFRSTLESLAFSAPGLLTGVAGAKAGAAAGGAIGTVVAPGPGSAIGAGVGGVAGFAGGTFAGQAATEVGAWINQSLEERGYDTSSAEDLVRAYRNKSLMAEVRGEAERKGVTTAGVDALFSVVAGKFLKGAGVGKIAKAKAAVKDIGVQSVGEGASEFAGQAAARKGDLSKVSLGEAVFEGISSMGHSVGEIGFRVGGEFGSRAKSFRSSLSDKTAIAAEEVVEQVQNAQSTVSELQALEQLGDIAKESNLQTRDPEEFAQFLAEANEDGGPDQAVYFQKEQWDEFWRERGESPVEKAEELLAIDNSYSDAEVSGQAVAISLKDYISKMGDKPEFGELMQIARTKPDGMNVSEAKETLEQTPQVLEELAAEAKAEKEMRDQVEIAGQEIKKRLETQLKEAGRDPIEAVPLTAFYQTMGAKEGINPLELAEKYGLNIKAVDESEQGGSETVFAQNDGKPDQSKLGLNNERRQFQEQISESTGRTQEAQREIISKPLAGAPKGRGFSQSVREQAATYAEQAGIPYRQQSEYVKVNVETAKKIAQAFEEMEHNPSDPEVAEAYQALIDETMAQYQVIKNSGLKIEVIKEGQPDPYGGNSKKLIEDVEKNNHMWLYPTDSGFGTIEDIQDNPLLVETEEVIDGMVMTANDIFRVVHDYFGHIKEGNGFRARGEENAWQSHVRMYSSKAARAMTTETRGQNSWLNYGPHGEKNRTAKVDDTVFADQKVGLLPEWVMTEALSPDEKTFNQDQRGRIRISGNDKFTIELLKSADKSTFFHESGHYFLEVLKDMASMDQASQELKDDFQTILKWLGVESADQIKTEQHEKWARGFEAYLREGKAPSSKLRKAFNTFKVWLTSVYRSAMQLNVEMSDDIRGVMDRMLATQEEIEQAKENMGDLPLFVDPIAAGMNEAQAKKYNDAVADANMSAKEELEAKAQRVVDRRKKIQAGINKDRIEAAISQEPIYKAIADLKSNDPIDGAPPLKFKRDLFKEKFPQFYGDKKFKGMFSDDDTGMSADMVAALLGYDNGEQLATDIFQTPDLKQVVAVEVERLTDEQFAVEESPEVLSQAADDALHNLGRAKRLRMEYEHLSKGLQNEVTRRVSKRPVPDSEIKEMSQNIINSMSVGTIKPNQYRLAERRYAKEAGKLLAAKDIEGAFLAKQRELLNYYLYKESQNAKAFVRRGEKNSKKFFDKDEKLAKTRDMDLISAARAVLSRYGLGNSKKDPLEHIAKIKEYNPDAYESISSIVSGLVSDPDIYTNVEYGRFVDLMDGMQSLWDLSKDSKEVEVDGQKISIEKATNDLSEEMKVFKKKGGQEKYDRTANEKELRNIKLLGLKSQFRRLEHWVDVMDLGKIDGPFRKYIYTPVSEASDKFTLENKKFKEKFTNLSRPIAEKIEVGKEIVSDELGFKFKDKSELLGALLHTGNNSNKKKLLVGRGWGFLDEEGGLVTNKWDSFIQRMWDDGTLTKEDYDYIQSVWDLMEEIKPQAQKAHKKIFGYYFDEITSNEIKTPFGNYKGGYAPAKVDPNAVSSIARKQELEEFIKSNSAYDWPGSGGRGFTKSRVDNFNKPLSLDMSLVGSHITSALKFSIIKPAVVDAAKIVTNQSFKEQMAEVDPVVIDKMIKPALNRADKNRISTSDPSDDGTLIRMANYLKTVSAMQLMFANVTNTIEQVAGIPVAATRIGSASLARSVGSYLKNPKKTGEFIRDKSVFMRTRTDDQIFEMEKISKDIFSEKTQFGKAKDFAKKHAYFTQAFTQNMIDYSVWQGSYDDSISSGLTESQAVRKADADIRLTQSSRRAFDVSNFETNEWIGVFNMFYSFFNTMANLNASNFTKLYYEDLGLKDKSAKGLYLLMMGYSSIAVVSAAVKKAAAGGLDEDEDDEYYDDLYDVFVGSQIDLGFAMIPIVGAGFNAGVKKITGGKAYETRVSASPAASIIGTATSGISGILDKTARGKDLKKSDVRDGLTALGLITGLPLRPLAKPINYVQDLESGDARPSGPIDALRGVVTGKPGVN